MLVKWTLAVNSSILLLFFFHDDRFSEFFSKVVLSDQYLKNMFFLTFGICIGSLYTVYTSRFASEYSSWGNNRKYTYEWEKIDRVDNSQN